MSERANNNRSKNHRPWASIGEQGRPCPSWILKMLTKVRNNFTTFHLPLKNFLRKFAIGHFLEKIFPTPMLQTKINPNTQEKYPASINLLKPLRFCNVTLQHQVLPCLVYFQSSSNGQNNNIMSDVVKNPVLCQYCNYINLQKHVNNSSDSFDKI